MKKIYLTAAFLSFCLASCRTSVSDSSRLDAFPINVRTVSRGTLEDTLILVGSVKARDEATLFSRVPGKLQANLLKEGDRVVKDQPVALVIRDEVGVKFEPAPVPSTLNGVVARLYLDRGANVTLDTPISLVLDDRELMVKADVPERYIGRLAVGQPVRIQVEAFPNKVFGGTVHRVSPAVDPATRTSPIEMILSDGRNHLRSGMFAKSTLVVSQKADVISLPADVIFEGPPAYVYVAENKKAMKRRIEIGLRTDTRIEIKNGIKEGEQVIVSGLFGIQDGSPVEVLADESR